MHARRGADEVAARLGGSRVDRQRLELGSHLAAHVLCRNRGDRDVSNAQLEGVRVLGVACTRPLHRARMSISPQPVEATGKTGIKKLLQVLQAPCDGCGSDARLCARTFFGIRGLVGRTLGSRTRDS